MWEFLYKKELWVFFGIIAFFGVFALIGKLLT